MDKAIEKKRASPLRALVIGAGAVVLVAVIWMLANRTSSSRLKVDSSRLTTAIVSQGQFLEYYPFDGAVEPATSVYLDIEEGGRVDQIFVEGGQRVEKGDLILRFSNASLQRTAIDTETQLLYQLDIARNTQFNRSQSTLLLKETLLDLDHQIGELEKKYRRYDVLMKNGNTAVSMELFETTRDQLKYLKDRRTLLAERVRQEDQMATQQLVQARHSIERLNASMNMIGKIVESLDVRAPIAGWLSTIDAQVGQNVTRGSRLGQIDLLDRFKIRVKIDQYYISRVEIGTGGEVNLDGKTWPVKVQKIYPEVKQSAFEADVVFEGEGPQNLKRGQTLTVELSFSAPSRSLTVAKGSYYQQTSGRWVYLVSPDGETAHRTDVRLGRQNPRQVEVLEGLREGDRIITSGYDSFNGVEELRFKEPIKSMEGKKK